jgi:hypothetical protein
MGHWVGDEGDRTKEIPRAHYFTTAADHLHAVNQRSFTPASLTLNTQP